MKKIRFGMVCGVALILSSHLSAQTSTKGNLKYEGDVNFNELANYYKTNPQINVQKPPREEEGVISIYPKPSAGVFTVVLPQAGASAEIMVTDMYGKVVENVRITDRRDREVTMNLGNMPNGTYLIRVSSDGIIYRGKVVIMSK